jgi:hypothetical protein
MGGFGGLVNHETIEVERYTCGSIYRYLVNMFERNDYTALHSQCAPFDKKNFEVLANHLSYGFFGHLQFMWSRHLKKFLR